MKAKKSLGQNFLIDTAVVDRIIEAGEISEKDNVLEIGPGRGFLTKTLTCRTNKVLAIEKDEELVDFCRKSLKTPNLEILTGDVLGVDWQKILNQKSFFPYKTIANIPYYITGKILRLFLENSFQPQILVLMVQKEVAERICAKPGKLGILSLSVQYFGEPEIVMIVPREKFEPVPEVDSAVIKIVVKNENRLEPEREKQFFRLVKVGFSHPRKTLINNLSNGLQIEKQEIEKILEQIGFKKNARAQELGVKDWKKMIEDFEIL